MDISKIQKAQSTFERFRINMKDDQDQAGAVHAFKFCFELSWKLLQRTLRERGLDLVSPKEIFRKAAIAGLIDNPEVWFEFLKKRNLTSHTYEEENLSFIVSCFDSFSSELAKLIKRLGESA